MNVSKKMSEFRKSRVRKGLSKEILRKVSDKIASEEI